MKFRHGIVAALLIMLLATLFNGCADSKRRQYNDAVDQMNSGECMLAESAFQRLGDYKDSAQKRKEAAYCYAVWVIDHADAEPFSVHNPYVVAWGYFRQAAQYQDADQRSQDAVPTAVAWAFQKGLFDDVTSIFANATPSVYWPDYSAADKALAADSAFAFVSQNLPDMSDEQVHQAAAFLIAAAPFTTNQSAVDEARSRLYELAVDSVTRNNDFGADNRAIFAWCGEYEQAAMWVERIDQYEVRPVIDAAAAPSSDRLGTAVTMQGLVAVVVDDPSEHQANLDALSMALKTKSLGAVFFTDDVSAATYLLRASYAYTNIGTYTYGTDTERTYFDVKLVIDLITADSVSAYHAELTYPGHIPDHISVPQNGYVAPTANVYPVLTADDLAQPCAEIAAAMGLS